jgi:hypothetical protein
MNSERLRLGELALSFVKRIEHIRPGNKRGDHEEKIEGSGARFGAALMRKKQRLFPDLGVWPLHAKHADSFINHSAARAEF